MIDQDKMRALATRLREDYEFSLSITSTRYRDAVSRTPIETADAIHLLLAEVEAAGILMEKAALLASAVIEYPDFDCDSSNELRPLCKIARDVLDAFEKQSGGA